jgi:hypothetical protein
MFLRRILTPAAIVLGVAVAISIGSGLGNNLAIAQGGGGFTSNFPLKDCQFNSEAINPYFILQPGYQLVLEGDDDGELVHLVITVLYETEKIDLSGLDQIETRIVEEREWVDGELVEISRNFFAQCDLTNDIYYFGEEVDIYEDGEIVSHDGAWRAGKNGARPGLIMPGTFLLGSRYFQERAPGVALDRAEHVAMGLVVDVPAGTFTDCVEVLETTPLEPGSTSTKRYCSGVGLVFDDGVELVDIGADLYLPIIFRP